MNALSTPICLMSTGTIGILQLILDIILSWNVMPGSDSCIHHECFN